MLKRRAYKPQVQHAAMKSTYISLWFYCVTVWQRYSCFPVISFLLPFYANYFTFLAWVGFPFVFKAELTVSGIHLCAAASQSEPPTPSPQLQTKQGPEEAKTTSSQRKGSTWEEGCLATLEAWDVVCLCNYVL